MHIVTVFVALAMAAIGATGYSLDSIGLGTVLIVCAAMVSQTASLSNTWWRNVGRRYGRDQSPATRTASMNKDVLKNAVFEVEEGSVDTRLFLKHIQTGLA